MKGLWDGVSGLMAQLAKHFKNGVVAIGIGFGKGLAITNITAAITNTPAALIQKHKMKKTLASLIVWHMEQQGVTGASKDVAKKTASLRLPIDGRAYAQLAAQPKDAAARVQGSRITFRLVKGHRERS